MELEINWQRLFTDLTDDVKEKLRDLFSWITDPLVKEFKNQMDTMNETLKGLSRKLGREPMRYDENGHRD